MEAMRSWLPQDKDKLAAWRGCSCQGRPPRPRVTTYCRDRKTARNPMRASVDGATWVAKKVFAIRRLCRLRRENTGDPRCRSYGGYVLHMDEGKLSKKLGSREPGPCLSQGDHRVMYPICVIRLRISLGMFTHAACTQPDFARVGWGPAAHGKAHPRGVGWTGRTGDASTPRAYLVVLI